MKKTSTVHKGYGTRILTEILQYLWKDLGCNRVQVGWVPYNKRGRGAYPDLAYKATNFFINRFGFKVSDDELRCVGNELVLKKPATPAV
jgi:RimJ/RimL family protein N-acetyltransferase